MFSTSDTIAAIATSTGSGAIGIVRVSGPEAHAIACTLLGREAPLEARRASFARVRIATPATMPLSDHVVATYFPAPHSYTTEDVVEIAAHGSPVLLEGILRGAVAVGARLAEPGEFTFRAFVNGRLDLTQAEAVADLIDAVTPLQARIAFDQLDGSLATAIAEMEERLFDLSARMEASLDFPEEGYHFGAPAAVAADVEALSAGVANLLSGAETGRVIREGARVTVVGRTNVGKSSVFNSLVGFDRAIVSAEPGTTRDLVSELVDLEGLPVLLVDTAGLRDTTHAVEREGLRRAAQAARSADVELVVLDRSEALMREDREILDRPSTGRRIIVVNKCDRPSAWAEDVGQIAKYNSLVEMSALAGTGVLALKRAIVELAGVGTERDVPRVTNVRHADLLRRCALALTRAHAALSGPGGPLPEEVVLLEVNEALQALGEVTGRRTPDDVLAHIFSRFCIGK